MPTGVTSNGWSAPGLPARGCFGKRLRRKPRDASRMKTRSGLGQQMVWSCGLRPVSRFVRFAWAHENRTAAQVVRLEGLQLVRRKESAFHAWECASRPPQNGTSSRSAGVSPASERRFPNLRRYTSKA